MPITRTFFDWREPALPATVAYLLGRYGRGDQWDVDSVILVFPGARAARRLLELLVLEAERRGLVLRPPQLCTVGELPEQLYTPKRPFANDLVQQLAWVKALQDTDAAVRQRFLHDVPPAEDVAGWLELGRLLQRQHRELAGESLNFDKVWQLARDLPGFEEVDRWKSLSQIQQRYLRILDELGLWDVQTARLVAIDKGECRQDKDIVLVGTSDMTLTVRLMLDQVAERVTALIHAPSTQADRFDAHGCLVPDAWQEVPIELATEQIRIVGGPSEQARAVVETIASYEGRYRADEIVVGVPDERLVPHLLRHLERARLPARWVVGKTMRDTTPFRLLAALADLLDGARYPHFAALVRHPDVASWLTRQGVQGDWITELDQFYNEHFPAQLGEWVEHRDAGSALREVVSRIRAQTQPLADQRRPLSAWSMPISQLLATFYRGRELNADIPDDQFTLKGLEQIRQALVEQQQVPAAIAPTVAVDEAIRLVLARVETGLIPSRRQPHQIELLGWLELPLDSAPALIATSFHEGCVPTSVNSDLFFPNSLRQQLGLLDNRRRFARDAYALSVLCASRRALTLIAGRRSAEGDPLIPSRLAFACDVATMARRAKAFFSDQPPAAGAGQQIHLGSSESTDSALVVRRPLPLAHPVDTLSVTSFRTYLACPYRFYLRHVLQLRPLSDESEELGGDTFGTLLHEVLSDFGKSSARSSCDSEEIRALLHERLAERVRWRFPGEHLPAIWVQISQARARLDAFARWQADWARQGWEIRHVETSGGSQPARLAIDDETSVRLTGRIDRIDHRQGQWVIFDYKTGDGGNPPQATHRQGDAWIDLQLPLYLHLARTLEICENVRVGYIVLPKDTSQTGDRIAQWDAGLLASADCEAIRVARDIHQGKFWPPTQPPPSLLSEYASICQDHAFAPRLETSPRRESKA